MVCFRFDEEIAAPAKGDKAKASIPHPTTPANNHNPDLKNYSLESTFRD
jgi:hypothetical protein